MASLWYPVLKCIWPQHVCARGKSTSTPRRSRTSTVARPVSGNRVSLKHVMKSAARTVVFLPRISEPHDRPSWPPGAVAAPVGRIRDYGHEIRSARKLSSVVETRSPTVTDRITNPWGERTPFPRDAEWPARADQYLEEGISEDEVDR